MDLQPSPPTRRPQPQAAHRTPPRAEQPAWVLQLADPPQPSKDTTMSNVYEPNPKDPADRDSDLREARAAALACGQSLGPRGQGATTTSAAASKLGLPRSPAYV